MSRAMAAAGSPASWSSIQTGSLTLIVAIGFILTVGGIGFRIIRGGGRRSTMARGFVIGTWVGAGLQDECGGHPGSAGDITIITAAGLPYHLEPPLRQGSA